MEEEATFGRAAAAWRIFALWSQSPLQHVAITGPRRNGKTWLLYELTTITRALANRYCRYVQPIQEGAM